MDFLDNQNDFIDFDVNWEDKPQIKHKMNKSSMHKRAVEDRALKRFIKNEQQTFNASRNLDSLAKRPKKNQQYRLVTEKSFNAYALIKSVLSTGQIEELYIAIYRINEPKVVSICNLIESGNIKKATFVVSNFFRETKKPEVWADKLATFCDEHRDVARIAFVHTHCKICLIHKNDDYYILEGSGNMSDNARIEQYIYENNEKAFNFHKEWMEDVVNKFKEKKVNK